MTLAFAAMNVPIYFFWWDKPQGVGCPVCIVQKPGNEDVIDQPESPDHSSLQGVGWMLSMWNQLCGVLHNMPGNIQETARNWTWNAFIKRIQLIIRLILLILLLIFLPIVGLLVELTIASETIFDMIALNGTPGSISEDSNMVRVPSFERTIKLEPENAMDKFIGYGSAVMFGAIHCAAWTFEFPSIAEEILWKVCSILVICGLICLALYVITGYTVWIGENSRAVWWKQWLDLLYGVIIGLYIFAWISLIVQPFVALRDLPPGVFKAVQWTSFIPHI